MGFLVFHREGIAIPGVLPSKETASGTATTVGPGGVTAMTIAATATITGIAVAGAVMVGARGHRTTNAALLSLRDEEKKK